MADLNQDLWVHHQVEETPIFSEINITPLTDIILVLLIIFMVSSSAMVDAAREGRLEISLPQASHTSEGDADPSALVIGLTADGKMFVDGQAVSEETIEARLKTVHKQQPQTAIVLDADGALPHGRVVHLIDQVKAAGFSAVHIGASDR